MAVPNNYNFTLDDVCDEIGLLGSNRNLVQCFNSAISSGFDPSYSGSKNSLRNFRNYNHSTISRDPVSLGADFGTSSQACTNYNSGVRVTRYVPSGQTFDNATYLYENSSSSNAAPAAWYSDGSIVKYWTGTAFQSGTLCV